jgi:hypothetical protein
VRADDDVAGRTYLVVDGADHPLSDVGRRQGELERDVLAEALVVGQHQRERIDLDRPYTLSKSISTSYGS